MSIWTEFSHPGRRAKGVRTRRLGNAVGAGNVGTVRKQTGECRGLRVKVHFVEFARQGVELAEKEREHYAGH